MRHEQLKNLPFHLRLRFAWRGIVDTLTNGLSFRWQLLLGTGGVLIFAAFRAQPLWWAVYLLTSGAVLALELLNTAIEKTIDALHPELHPLLGRAKDCASGAVLVLSATSVLILLCFLYDVLRRLS